MGAGAKQCVVKTFGVAGGLDLFGLQHEVATQVTVDAASAAATVAVAEGDGPLEHIALLGRGMRRLHTQQLAQLGDKTLRRGQLAGGHTLPALNEGAGSRAVAIAGVVAVAFLHQLDDSGHQVAARRVGQLGSTLAKSLISLGRGA